MFISNGSYYSIDAFPTPRMFSTPVELSVENMTKYLFKLYYRFFRSGRKALPSRAFYKLSGVEGWAAQAAFQENCGRN
ncbi:hypothetical protein HKBW3S44_00549 [Candidatus Hakubella thermalkaliphila]|uniref:Uncharacterized protein n=1 Tax=Candidatus Hakubella thermalkaliphila TaxID=2754717 RepID=A0A6V8PWN3_9ACTN|nr:hypothetical protein HKBW3S34_01923 [Candidatus Hakubella thermalkaliphila]GFP36868.1 hypothetical protein HKBW3S44_00549 [Candidatus Hakubella thermalkaliphila]